MIARQIPNETTGAARRHPANAVAQQTRLT